MIGCYEEVFVANTVCMLGRSTSSESQSGVMVLRFLYCRGVDVDKSVLVCLRREENPRNFKNYIYGLRAPRGAFRGSF